MRKWQFLTGGLLVTILMIGLLAFTPLQTDAIGKVTPTPGAGGGESPPPAEPTPVPNLDLTAEEYYERGAELIAEGDFEGAIAEFSNAIQVDDDYADAYIFRGLAYRAINLSDEAIDDLTRAIELRPYDWFVYTYRGDTYALSSEPGEAMFDYNQAIYLNPRHSDAFASRSALHSQRGDDELALIDARIAEGVDRSSQGDNQTALELFTDAINEVESNPAPDSIALAYYNRANIYLNLGDDVKAIEDFDAAIELMPDMQDFYMGRGFAYSERGDHFEAGLDFIRRIELVERESFTNNLTIGDTVEVEMAYGFVHRITFAGNAGDTVSITARDSDGSGVDPLMVLLGPDGNAIAGNDDGGGDLDSALDNFRLPEDGTFTIVVSHANASYDGFINVSVD